MKEILTNLVSEGNLNLRSTGWKHNDGERMEKIATWCSVKSFKRAVFNEMNPVCLDWNSTVPCHQYRLCLHSTLFLKLSAWFHMVQTLQNRDCFYHWLHPFVHTASLKISGFNKRTTKPQRTTWFHSSTRQSHIFNFRGIFKSIT